MWVLTITNFKTAAADNPAADNQAADNPAADNPVVDTDKPAFWIDGGIHANEIQASEVVLYTAWYLLEMYVFAASGAAASTSGRLLDADDEPDCVQLDAFLRTEFDTALAPASDPSAAHATELSATSIPPTILITTAISRKCGPRSEWPHRARP